MLVQISLYNGTLTPSFYFPAAGLTCLEQSYIIGHELVCYYLNSFLVYRFYNVTSSMFSKLYKTGKSFP